MLLLINDDYGGWIFLVLVCVNGGKYFNEDYLGEVYYNLLIVIGVLCFWQDLIYKDKVMLFGVLNLKQISVVFFFGKFGMVMFSIGVLGFMCENSKDFEFGVVMLLVKEQCVVLIGGVSLVSFKGINEVQKKVVYQFLIYLVSFEVNGVWSCFIGYFLLCKVLYDMLEMKVYLQQDLWVVIVFEQLKYVYLWYFIWEIVVVCKVMENQLVVVVNDVKVMLEVVVQVVQKEVDVLMKLYVDKIVLVEVK